MVHNNVRFPSVFVVDSKARPPPIPPKSGRRQRSEMVQTLLVILVSVALCGMAVEACFIYYLHKSNEKPLAQTPSSETQVGKRTQEDTAHLKHKQRGPMKPSKPMAHLTTGRPQANTARTGIVLWNVSQESILHHIKHKADEGKLIIEKEGYYSVYSKIHIKENSTHFIHSVFRVSPRLPGYEITLLQSSRLRPKPMRSGTEPMENSYLSGVFHLLEGDSVFVKVKNCIIVFSNSAENYFGLFMV